MNQRICRAWNMSVIAVLVLTFYNIYLAFELTQNVDCNETPSYPGKTIQIIPAAASYNISIQETPSAPIDITLGRYDNSLEYKFFDNSFIGNDFSSLSRKHKTCLATQCSLEKMHSIVQVANHWDGPISLAAFGSGDEDFNNLLHYIAFLRKCFSNIRRKVNIHLSYPRRHAPRKILVNASISNRIDCEHPNRFLMKLTDSKYTKKFQRWKRPVIYPQNHLRNLARKNCQSEYVFLTDIDVVPSFGMNKLLDEFLEKNECDHELCAFVIPTFELDERVRFPSNKSELLRLVDKGLARPFHQKVFIYNQFATNFSRWQLTKGDGPKVHINHPVTNFEFLYEPFYVARDRVPVHDERFVGYGYTRNTQVYEMFLAGYQFLVLSPIFTIHWGLQMKKTRPPWRESQNTKNMKKFKDFKRELFVKYKLPLPLKMQNEAKMEAVLVGRV